MRVCVCVCVYVLFLFVVVVSFLVGGERGYDGSGAVGAAGTIFSFLCAYKKKDTNK